MHGDAAALQAVSVAAEHATLRTLQALFPSAETPGNRSPRSSVTRAGSRPHSRRLDGPPAQLRCGRRRRAPHRAQQVRAARTAEREQVRAARNAEREQIRATQNAARAHDRES